jgi:polyhydroxybutyrate depolymerase
VVVDADFCSLLTCPIPETLNDERPSEFVLPSDYDPAKEYPLVVVLHGFGANGPIQSLYMGVSPAVDDRDFILVHPNGTELPSGTKFWYSGAPCCGFPVDDVSYITGLINDAKGAFNVNDYQVYLWGHSNGGFMSFTMACEASSSITAIASLAGSSFVDAGDCGPSDEPVSVLQIHGTDDGIISYDDSAFSPGAEAMFERTAGFLGCDLGSLTVGPTLDIVGNLDGEETTARACNDGCIGDTSAELWTIEDGPHIPSFNTNFAENVLDWLFSKSR